MRYRIRYNKTAGQPGRGTIDHKWRVFDETGKEWLCKAVRLQAAAWTEIDPNGVDAFGTSLAEVVTVTGSTTTTFTATFANAHAGTTVNGEPSVVSQIGRAHV